MTKENDRIRVLLADDHTLFREGIRQMLETDPRIRVVGGAADGEEAIHLARQTQPHVVLLDLQMPKKGGEEAIRHLLRISSSPRILILSMRLTNEPFLRRLVAQGASGYVSKSASIEQLLAAVHNAVECPRSPKGDEAIVVVAPKILGREEGEDPLSGRELEVLLLAARGLSNRQIAGSLLLGEATVKRHLANIYFKMGVGSRGEAVNKALSKQWFSIEDMS